MFIRPYRSGDKEILEAMLREDYGDISRFDFNRLETNVMVKDETPIGFFTLKEEHDHPSLRHFFIQKKHRTPDNARMLAKALVGAILLKGASWGILCAPKNMPYIKKLIEYYWKIKPYNETDEAWFYLLNVRTI